MLQQSRTMTTVAEKLPPFAMPMLSMRIVSSFSLLFIFLWIGHVLREKIMLFRRIMMPASLIGGLVGLLFVQLASLSAPFGATVRHDWIVGWSTLPGFLNNIVFATLFLGTRIPGVKEIMNTAAPQIAYGWFLAFGCWVVVCSVTGILLMRVWNVNILFSTLGPVGFTGGHGTAGGLGETYDTLGFPKGGDLALTSATIGILFGVVVGTVLVNVANQLGWTYQSYKVKNPDYEAQKKTKFDKDAVPVSPTSPTRRGSKSFKEAHRLSRTHSLTSSVKDDIPLWKMKAIVPTSERVSSGEITVSGDAIETLALHLCYIAAALMLAYWTKRILIFIEGLNGWLTKYSFFTGFPLFPLCLLWGIVLQLLINRVCEHSPLSRGMIERIGGTALDILVLSAIATTNLSAVAEKIAPLLILTTSLLMWQVIAFLFFAPRMLPDFWTERACAEFGVGTATTSIGLMLMRSIDPEFETPAVRAFAAKQLFTEPLLGGGLITSLMLPLIKSLGNFVVAGICLAVMVVISCLWFFLLRREKLGPMTQYKFQPEYNRFM